MSKKIERDTSCADCGKKIQEIFRAFLVRLSWEKLTF
jgi:ribosomal protein L34E